MITLAFLSFLLLAKLVSSNDSTNDMHPQVFQMRLETLRLALNRIRALEHRKIFEEDAMSRFFEPHHMCAACTAVAFQVS